MNRRSFFSKLACVAGGIVVGPGFFRAVPAAGARVPIRMLTFNPPLLLDYWYQKAWMLQWDPFENWRLLYPGFTTLTGTIGA